MATDILDTSGRAMLDALVGGTMDPAGMAELARGRMRPKRAELRQALAGHFRAHLAFLVTQIFAHVEYLDAWGILTNVVLCATRSGIASEV